MSGRKTIQRPGGIPGLLRLCLLVLALSLLPVPQVQATPPSLPVLTLDFERLFSESRWGQRIAADMARDSAALGTENARIADDLIAEEKSLTDRRAKLAPEAFRAEADAFDERATGIRAAQKAKAQALTQNFDAARQAFFEATGPFLDEILAGRGAVMVLDRRAIIRGLEAADITDDLVHLLDERLGEGPTVAQPEAPTPEGGE